MEEIIRGNGCNVERRAEGKRCSFSEELGKQKGDLCRMLETRDRQLQDSLVSRDQAWLTSLHYCKENLRLMSLEKINMRATMETIGKRQCELTKENTEILN